MRLSRLAGDWERLGHSDPHWAVLSHPAKRSGGWDIDEFDASGRYEIDEMMAYVSALRPELARGDALDFGCGPGRLTFPLADHYSRAVGVDISSAMIELAQARNKSNGAKFILNRRPDLSVFDDESFDFVYSMIVLQHNPPALARSYLAEFLRVLRPGGLAVFQIPEALGALLRLRRAVGYRLNARRDDASTVRMFGLSRRVPWTAGCVARMAVWSRRTPTPRPARPNGVGPCGRQGPGSVTPSHPLAPGD